MDAQSYIIERQRLTLGEGHTIHANHHPVSGLQVPQPYCPVVTAGGRKLAVGRPSHTLHQADYQQLR